MNLMPGGSGVSTDVCVPISRLAECVNETHQDIQDAGLLSTIVGHVGDGNFHCMPLAMPDDKDMNARISKFVERLSERAIRMGAHLHWRAWYRAGKTAISARRNGRIC